MIIERPGILKEELRKFGLTFGIVVGAIGAYLFWKENGASLYFIGVAFVTILFGIIRPALLLYFYKIWMFIGGVMGWINTRIILAIIFYLILTPIALILRLFGKQFIEKKWDKSAKSYWNIRESSIPEGADYEKQF